MVWRARVYELPRKPQNENFFTPFDQATKFDTMTPHRARKTAIQLARAKNNEWMPPGTSVAYHNARTDIFSKLQLTVGSFRKGGIDPIIKSNIEPALNILGDVVELLEIVDGTIFRFHYHGLIKHKAGMEAWTETAAQSSIAPFPITRTLLPFKNFVL